MDSLNTLPPQPEQTMNQPPAQPAQKIGRFKASKIIVKESWNILKHDKEMMLFPIASLFVSLAVWILIVVAFFFLALNGSLDSLKNTDNSEQFSSWIYYAVLFVIYFITFFITVFFETGIVTIAYGRLRGQDLTFRDGLNNAFKHIGKIAAWSLLSATVGVILRAIADRSKLLGKIIIAILGAAWSLLTFFIVPILIVEELPLKDSLKKSASIISKIWGEYAIVNIGVGLYIGLLALLGIVPFVVSLFTANVKIILAMLILTVLYWVLLGIISATLSVIFKVVLYEYSNTGTVPQGFSPEVMQMAFKNK